MKPTIEHQVTDNSLQNKDTSMTFMIFSQESNISVPKNNEYLGINIIDWSRLKRMISQCKSGIDGKFQNIAYTLFGISGSSFLSFITTIATKPFENHNTIIAIIFLLITLITIGVGILCLYFHSKEAKRLYTSIENVEAEMSSMEEAATYS